MEGSILQDLLNFLDILIMERRQTGVFRIIQQAPAWFQSLCPELDPGKQAILIDRHLSFPGTFLHEAEQFWQNGQHPSLSSIPWVETNPYGKTYDLKATAVFLGKAPVLIIEHSSAFQLRKTKTLLKRETSRRKQLEKQLKQAEKTLETLPKVEAKIQHVNAVLQSIRNINQLIVREKNRQRLIQAACDYLTDNQSYESAWMMLSRDAGRPLLLAESGIGEHFPRFAEYVAQEQNIPCLTSILSGKVVRVLEPSGAFCDDCPAKELICGGPTLAIPLIYAEKTYGLLSVCLPSMLEPNIEELVMVEEIAGDMAFALHNIDVEEGRQHAEHAIREHERWLTAILKYLGEAVVATDEKGGVTFFNPMAETLTGWKAQEVIGQDIAFNMLSEAPEPEDELQARRTARRQITIILAKETFLIDKSGKKIPIEYSGNPILDDDGGFVGFVMVFKDITERKQAEANLESSLSLLRSTLESTADGILVYNIEKQDVVMFNQRFIEMWDMPKPEVVPLDKEVIQGILLERILAPHIFMEIFEDLRNQADARRYDGIELKNGKIIEVYSHPQMIGAKRVGTVLSFHDITERKQAEDALHYQVTFGNLINTIATHFINLGPTDIAEGILNALHTIGTFANVDHGYVSQLSEDGMSISITHEWWKDGISDALKHDRRTEIGSFAWAIMEYLERKGILHIPGGTDLSSEPISEQELSKLTGAKSLIMIPLVSLGKLKGVLSFEAIETERIWTEDMIAILRIVAEVFSNAFERKRTEEALEHERQRLFALLEKLPMYVYLQSPTLSIRFANRSFRERFGEPGSRHYYRMFAGRESLWEDGPMANVLQTGEPQQWEWSHYPTGRIFQVHDYPFTDIDGSPLVMEFGIDITERKQMELALERERASLAQKVKARTAELSSTNALLQQEIVERKQAQKALEQAKEVAESANRAKSEFLANMSHELRTPLNAILGYAQILKQAKNLEERQREILDIVKNSGKHLLNLINEILDLSKIEAGRMELYVTDVYFPDFLKRIADMIQIRAKQKNISFGFTTEEPLPVGVKTDEKRLRQVLINLLDNAIKFTEEGQVTLTVTPLDQPPSEQPPGGAPDSQGSTVLRQIRFQVEDTGMGIAAEKLKEIFLPFQQVGEKTYSIEGTGLGLTISSKIVKMLGSELMVQSTLHEGTTFHFELPMEEIPGFVPTDRSLQRAVVGYKGEKRTVLLVDDKAENRLLLKDMLAPLGFTVFEAANGQECVEKMLEHKPDITLLDLRMPVMTGFEAAKEIRQTRNIREGLIIAVSASVYRDVRKRSLDAGCDDFLAKPIQLDELLDKVQFHLGLEWMYEKAEQEAEPEKTGEQAQEAPPAFSLPPEEVATLKELASSGRVKPLLQHLTELDGSRPQHKAITQEIRQYAKRFQLKKILEMLEKS